MELFELSLKVKGKTLKSYQKEGTKNYRCSSSRLATDFANQSYFEMDAINEVAEVGLISIIDPETLVRNINMLNKVLQHCQNGKVTKKTRKTRDVLSIDGTWVTDGWYLRSSLTGRLYVQYYKSSKQTRRILYKRCVHCDQRQI